MQHQIKMLRGTAISNALRNVQSLDSSKYSSHAKMVVYNGLWMDHFSTIPTADDVQGDAQGIISVCTAFIDGQTNYNRDLCFLYAPTAFLFHQPREYATAISWCERGCVGSNTATATATATATPDQRDGNKCLLQCTKGVGSQTYKENFGDVALAARTCEKAKESFLRAACLKAASLYHSMATSTHWNASFCMLVGNSTDTGTELRQACLQWPW